MIDELVFVDTNVLLYAHDRSAGSKHARAADLVASLWGTRTGLLSTQVLQEFYVNATRKLSRPLSASQARRIVARYATWPVHLTAPADIIAASELEKRHQLAFWDALIIIAAQRSGAAVISTEDMQHGRRFGPVTIEDPFAG